jgi:hypothetical protein
MADSVLATMAGTQAGSIAKIRAEVLFGNPDRSGTPKTYRMIQVHRAADGSGTLALTPFDDSVDAMETVALSPDTMSDLARAIGPA